MKFFALSLAATLWVCCDGCTVFIVGKKASKDGSVMISHSNDGEFETDPRLIKIPAADYPSGSNRAVYYSPESYPRYVGYERGDIPEYFPKEGQQPFEPIGFIPQVNKTVRKILKMNFEDETKWCIGWRCLTSLTPLPSLLSLRTPMER